MSAGGGPIGAAFSSIASTAPDQEDVPRNEGDGKLLPQGRLLVSNFSSLGTSSCRLVLASQSPRRREILDMMGLTGRYVAEPSPLDEGALQAELLNGGGNEPDVVIAPESYARILAEHKAEAMGRHLLATGESGDNGDVGRLTGGSTKTTFVLGSDTIVDLDGKILEKPIDESDAVRMLSGLSGRWHKVHTGVALYRVRQRFRDDEEEDSDQRLALVSSFTDTSNVKFADLTQRDILAYVRTGEPMDKAGSYGIQGVGGQLVEMIEGDFFTIMGLPMHRLSKALSGVISDL